MAITDKLTNVANAIRTKTGESSTMTLTEMPQKILDIQTGENLDTELTTQETTIDDIETALQNKVSPPAPPPRILTDDDLIPENIKKGVEVLGVTGTYEGPYAVTKESFSVKKISVSSVTLTPPSGFNHLAYVGIADSFVAYGTAPTIKITIPDANGTTVNVTMTGSGTLTLLAVWSKL